MTSQPIHYDYIITGGGCAGLSLLARMIESGKFKDKKVLLIDKERRHKNDRTWCFWETNSGFFESIVYAKWDRLNFYGEQFESLLEIAPYRYKMIRGIDFYEYTYQLIEQSNLVDMEWGAVSQLMDEGDSVAVSVNEKQFTADYVFNSILFEKPDLTNYFSLQQHFKGWFIRTREKFFRPEMATLMDFRVDQHHGTTFMYVLPFDEHRALLEYTLFTRDLLSQDEYERELKKYTTTFLGLEHYEIEEQEFGVIPMTNYPFPSYKGRIINLGTAGGQTKASSGYTFQFIQKHTAALIEALVNTGSPYLKESWLQKRFSLYDSTLLHVLDNRKLEGKKVFTDMFKNGDPQTVLKFLDNETSLWEDLTIMYRLPKLPFAKAAWRELKS